MLTGHCLAVKDTIMYTSPDAVLRLFTSSLRYIVGHCARLEGIYWIDIPASMAPIQSKVYIYLF